jgi:hypothetical protein
MYAQDQHHKDSIIVGKWVGVSSKKDTVNLVFQGNGTIVWKYCGPKTASITTAKYILKNDGNLIEIRMFDFDEPFLSKMKVEFLGSITIVNNDNIILAGEQLIAKKSRNKEPKVINAEEINLHRIK